MACKAGKLNTCQRRAQRIATRDPSCFIHTHQQRVHSNVGTKAVFTPDVSTTGSASKPMAVPPLAAPGAAPTPCPVSGNLRGAAVTTNSTAVQILYPAEDVLSLPVAPFLLPPGGSACGEQPVEVPDVWTAADAMLNPDYSSFMGSIVSPAIIEQDPSSSTGTDVSNPASQLLQLVMSYCVSAFQAYGDALENRPIVAKAATALFTWVVGDIIAQQSQYGTSALDVLRLLRQGSYGVVDGPVGHHWYGILDRVICPKEPTSMKAVFAKTAADQLIWSPIMTCVFFAYLNMLEGTPAEVWPTIQHKLVPTLAANYAFWPVVHLVNFRYVPTKYRIPYNSLLCIVWTTYLSWSSHSGVCH